MDTAMRAILLGTGYPAPNPRRQFSVPDDLRSIVATDYRGPLIVGEDLITV